METMSRTSLLFAVPLLLIGSAAHADSVLETKVPFPFTVQNHVLPAGQYRIEHDSVHPSILVIKGEKGLRATFITSTVGAPGQDPAGNKPVLVFTRHDQTYQLKDVWENAAEGQEVVQR